MKRAIAAACIVTTGTLGIGYAVWATTVHLAVDDPPRMTTVHISALTVIAVAFLASCGWAAILRVEAGQRRVVSQVSTINDARMARLETEYAASAARSDRRYEVLRTALVSLGADLSDITGEIRRGAGSAAVPRIDPATLHLMHELDRYGLPPRGIEQ